MITKNPSPQNQNILRSKDDLLSDKSASPSFSEFTVDSLLPQQEAFIKELPENPLLPCLGLREGKPVQMITRQKFGGPLVIKMNGRSIAISRTLARRIKLDNNLEIQAEV